VPSVTSVATWSLTLPNNHLLLGLQFFTQRIVPALPNGISASNLGDVVVGDV